MAFVIFLSSSHCFAEGATEHLFAIHLISKHLGNKNYNEENSGIGLRLGNGNWYGAIGFFRNSLGRDSVYVGGGKEIWRIGPASINLNAGAATGYAASVTPFLSPEIVLKIDRVRMMINYLPKIKTEHVKTEHTFALSIGVPF